VPGGLYVLNSAIITVGTVVGQLITASLAGYAFARMRFPGKDIIFAALVASMAIPGAVTLIPGYVFYARLNWINTYLPLIIPSLVVPFGIFMLTQFFKSIPKELEEAAYIDGASWGRMFRSVLLPLVMPGLVATSVFSFITAWNEFIFAMTLLGGASENYTVAIGLKQFFGEHTNEWGYIMAASTIITIPVMIFFVIVQRRLSAGLVAGAVKG